METPPKETAQRALEGEWGGLHIILTVNESSADLTMDCATGKISKPIVIDDAGRFELTGTFTAQTPGPSRPGGDSSRPVRYSGTIQGDSMTLSIADEKKPNEKLGNFTLTHGKAGRIWRCL